MSALVLLAAVLVLVAIAAPLGRRELRTTRTITFTIHPDVTAALRAFAAAGVTAKQAADRMRAAMEQLAKEANR